MLLLCVSQQWFAAEKNGEESLPLGLSVCALVLECRMSPNKTRKSRMSYTGYRALGFFPCVDQEQQQKARLAQGLHAIYCTHLHELQYAKLESFADQHFENRLNLKNNDNGQENTTQ